MNITYQDLCIRNAEAEDCQQLAKWWNDGEVMANAGFPNGLGISEREIEVQIANDSDDTKRRLMVEYQGKAFGEMVYSVYDHVNVKIGFNFCEKAFRGNKLGRIVLSMLIDELFHRGAKKIFLDTNLHNTQAQYVYDILGFKRVGIRENAWRNQVGELQTFLDYELAPADFIDAKKIS